MKLSSFLRLSSKTTNPQANPSIVYNLYSLPSFDDGRKCEVVHGSEIQSNKFIVPDKCLLFNKLNVRFKRIWRIDNTEPNKIASTEFLPLVVDESIVDFHYCYYLLRSDRITDYLTGQNTNTSGSHKRIDPDNFFDIEVSLPPLEDQKRIGEVLSNLDMKIDINTSLNHYLEAMAKQLYDYWFVQFDFPDANGNPYKSSGGKMIWNEKLRREIPEGWEDCTLGRYVGRITNGLNPRKNFTLGHGNNYYVTIRSLLGTDIDWDNCDRCDDEALTKINSRSQLTQGDVIFSAIGTIGRTFYIQDFPSNWNISETSFTLRAAESIPSDLFYCILRSAEIQRQADKNAMGSTLRCLVMDSLLKIPYIWIPENLRVQYAKFVRPILKQINELNKSTRQLIMLRNETMLVLMNGQVSVRQLNNDLSAPGPDCVIL